VDERLGVLQGVDMLLAKALRIPPDARFRRLEVTLARALMAEWARHAKEAALSAMSAVLDGATPAGVVDVIDREMEQFSKDVMPAIETTLQRAYSEALGEAVTKAAKPPDITPTDRRTLRALERHQVFWIGEFWSERLSSIVAETVKEEMLRQGRSIEDTAEAVRRKVQARLSFVQVPKGFNGTIKQYFEMVAANVVTVGRTHARIRRLKQVRAHRYRFQTADDEKVCGICNHMDGKIFLVEDAVRQMERELAAKTPEALAKAHPWPTIRTLLAISLRPGDVGPADSKRLVEAGIVSPPLHPVCRCTIEYVD
jgi:hypothetical protein